MKADIGSGATEDYALFNRKESGENYDPVLLKENPIAAGVDGDPYALVYSVKYKGLIERDKATSLRFVCQKNNSASTFFLTTSTATFCSSVPPIKLNGPKKCANEDGFFVPPESALDYSRAMMLLKDASNPDPTAETNDEYAVPVDSLGTAVNYVHTQSVTDSVQLHG